MITGYITIALRVFRKHKLYSFINLLGLSVGLASALLIGIYVVDELSYDQHIADGDRIFRLGITEIFEGKAIWYTDTGAPVADAMRTEIPEVSTTVRLANWPNTVVRAADKAFIERNFLLADSNFFEFFGHRLVVGNAKECLKGKNKVAISESAARKYFGYQGSGDVSPIGKPLSIGSWNATAEVSAIFADFPENTHMKADVIQSLEFSKFSFDDCWACYGVKTYFKLNDAQSLPAIETKLGFYIKEKVLPRIEKDLKVSHDQFAKSGDKVFFFVQPLKSIHLTSHHNGEFEPNGDSRYVYAFGLIACFIILLACINFINLTTARAINRAKEVGIRKTVGALRVALVRQFMTESFMYVGAAALLAIIIAFCAMNSFNLLCGKNLSLGILSHPGAMATVVSLIIVVSLLAGSYPAFYLTRFQPIDILRNKNSNGSYRSLTRNGLVVVQFAISMTLIMSTIVVSRQVEFIQNQKLGFEKENILRIAETDALADKAKSFKDELLTHSDFINASYSIYLPPRIEGTFFVRHQALDRLISCYYMAADEDHLKTMGYELKSGRFFSRDFPSDSSAALINETAAKLLGYDSIDGKTLSSSFDFKFNLIGIVKDFNFASLHEEIQPLVFVRQTSANNLAVRLAPGNISEKLELAESIWKKFSNGLPFQYSFVEDELNDLIQSERKMGQVFWIFSFIAMFVAVLGLFGLITFTASQRIKEIGIRKILGASAKQITYLLSTDLLGLVAMSFLISVPVCFYFMSRWLEGFAYRIDFEWWSVGVAGVIGFLLAAVTVGYRSFMAALANPTDSLKNE